MATNDDLFYVANIDPNQQIVNLRRGRFFFKERLQKERKKKNNRFICSYLLFFFCHRERDGDEFFKISKCLPLDYHAILSYKPKKKRSHSFSSSSSSSSSKGETKEGKSASEWMDLSSILSYLENHLPHIFDQSEGFFSLSFFVLPFH